MGDAFVTKLDPANRRIVYSTYLGASAGEFGLGVAVDAAGNAFVVGATNSADFPLLNPLRSQHEPLSLLNPREGPRGLTGARAIWT